jgi:hypothetical protein
VVIVLASRYDISARALVDGLAKYCESAVLTARDLSVAGWRHWVPGGPDGAVVAGSLVPTDRIQAVVVRLQAVTEQELPHIVAADRPYVAAEMNSFLQSWLDAIPCRVFNRPAGAHLCGPGWRPEQWIRGAWRLGIRAEPIARRHGFEETAPRKVGLPLQTVTVVGGASFGPGGFQVHDAALRLAAAAGALLLQAYFRDGWFVAADSFPDLSKPERQIALLRAIDA